MTELTFPRTSCPTRCPTPQALVPLHHEDVCARHDVLIPEGLGVLSNCLSNSCPTRERTLKRSLTAPNPSPALGSHGSAEAPQAGCDKGFQPCA